MTEESAETSETRKSADEEFKAAILTTIKESVVVAIEPFKNAILKEMSRLHAASELTNGEVDGLKRQVSELELRVGKLESRATEPPSDATNPKERIERAMDEIRSVLDTMIARPLPTESQDG